MSEEDVLRFITYGHTAFPTDEIQTGYGLSGLSKYTGEWWPPIPIPQSLLEWITTHVDPNTGELEDVIFRKFRFWNHRKIKLVCTGVEAGRAGRAGRRGVEISA